MEYIFRIADTIVRASWMNTIAEVATGRKFFVENLKLAAMNNF